MIISYLKSTRKSYRGNSTQKPNYTSPNVANRHKCEIISLWTKPFGTLEVRTIDIYQILLGYCFLLQFNTEERPFITNSQLPIFEQRSGHFEFDCISWTSKKPQVLLLWLNAKWQAHTIEFGLVIFLINHMKWHSTFSVIQKPNYFNGDVNALVNQLNKKSAVWKNVQ